MRRAGCACLAALPPALAQAVQATVGAYGLQIQRLFRPLSRRAPTAEELREIERLGRETSAYLGRLLSAYGWPADVALSRVFAGLLGEGRLQYCAGQAALKAAITPDPDEQSAAASLIDQGLNRLDQLQLYGTLYIFRGRRAVSLPIQDEANVKARRAALGLWGCLHWPKRWPRPGPIYTDSVCFVNKPGQLRFANFTPGIRFSPSRIRSDFHRFCKRFNRSPYYPPGPCPPA